jgi:hypothetical protein
MYHHYDHLNHKPPPLTQHIHSTFRTWYQNTPHTIPRLQTNTPHIISTSTPRQQNGWSCGMHVLLINLTTIYLGNTPIPKRTQTMAHTVSRLYLRYSLTGELDTHNETIIKKLTTRTTTKTTPPSVQPSTTRTHSHPNDTIPTTPISNKRTHNETQPETYANKTTSPKRMKLRHPQTQTNNTSSQDTNNTPPLRYTLTPSIPIPTSRKHSLKRPRRQTIHANTQLHIKQRRGWTLPGPSPNATITTYTTQDTQKPKVPPPQTPHTHPHNPTSPPQPPT